VFGRAGARTGAGTEGHPVFFFFADQLGWPVPRGAQLGIPGGVEGRIQPHGVFAGVRARRRASRGTHRIGGQMSRGWPAPCRRSQPHRASRGRPAARRLPHPGGQCRPSLAGL